MNIVISNLTEAQAIAIEDLLAKWQHAGSLGCSRWTSFFADGDGNFRPKITVNGESPKHTELVDQKKLWTGKDTWQGDYKIDYDRIAWALNGRN